MKPLELQYITKYDFSPAGLPKVYVSCHPEDRRFLKILAGDLFAIRDCAVYYHSGDVRVPEIDLEDWEWKLKEMKLFVILVTKRYLTEETVSRMWEFGFAVSHHIPVLPIAMEPGLELLFSRAMNAVGAGYGDIQMLNRLSADPTEITYGEKLRRDVEAILLNDLDLERVRGAFDAQIFLSYRKKDRKYANELMRTIHSIPSFRSLAIWYDEFLTIGESWGDNIQSSMESSDLFLMLVTPSLLEPDNYVIRHEYPEARRLDMKIMPVSKATDTNGAADFSAVKNTFPGIDIIINGDDREELEAALQSLRRKDEENPERKFLIGLAFLNGVRVEKDPETAVSLIVAASNEGLPEAVGKLADMYWSGQGVPVNYEESIRWLREQAGLYLKICQKNANGEAQLARYESMRCLVGRLYDLSAYSEAYEEARKLVRLADSFVRTYQSSGAYQCLARACDLTGKVCVRMNRYQKAVEYYETYCSVMDVLCQREHTDENEHDRSIGYERLGDIYYKRRNDGKAMVWYEKARNIREELNDRLNNEASNVSASYIYMRIGDVLLRSKDYGKAEEQYEKVLAIREKLMDRDADAANRRAYAEVLTALGDIAWYREAPEQACKRYLESLELFRGLSRESGTAEAMRDYAIALDRLGNVEAAGGKLREALQHFEESLSVRKQIAEKVRTDETVCDCAVASLHLGSLYQQMQIEAKALAVFDEAIESLGATLERDVTLQPHEVFAELSYHRYQADTFHGKRHLKRAIESWAWLLRRKPDQEHYRRQYRECRNTWERCYPKNE